MGGIADFPLGNNNNNSNTIFIYPSGKLKLSFDLIHYRTTVN